MPGATNRVSTVGPTDSSDDRLALMIAMRIVVPVRDEATDRWTFQLAKNTRNGDALDRFEEKWERSPAFRDRATAEATGPTFSIGLGTDDLLEIRSRFAKTKMCAFMVRALGHGRAVNFYRRAYTTAKMRLSRGAF